MWPGLSGLGGLGGSKAPRLAAYGTRRPGVHGAPAAVKASLTPVAELDGNGSLVSQFVYSSDYDPQTGS